MPNVNNTKKMNYLSRFLQHIISNLPCLFYLMSPRRYDLSSYTRSLTKNGSFWSSSINLSSNYRSPARTLFPFSSTYCYPSSSSNDLLRDLFKFLALAPSDWALCSLLILRFYFFFSSISSFLRSSSFKRESQRSSYSNWSKAVVPSSR